MKITDRLKVEHGVFLRQLRYLDHLLEHDASKAVLHQIFPLVEEILPPERLTSLSNWDAEHIREALSDPGQT